MQQNTSLIGMLTSTDEAVAAGSTQTKVALCAGVLPVWARHLASSRSQSETAVSEMMQAFASIGPHLGRAQQQSQLIDTLLGQHGGPFKDLAQACEKALAPLSQYAQLPPDGAAAISATLALVRNAVASIEQLTLPVSQETDAVAEHVERMYIGFQYQDRISQMIALLETDIARLQDAMNAQNPDIPDLPEWLARLESQYAMAEQHQSHAGDAHSGRDDGGEETVFF
jgi:hypothetical protein